jgi:hypothetical protein
MGREAKSARFVVADKKLSRSLPCRCRMNGSGQSRTAAGSKLRQGAAQLAAHAAAKVVEKASYPERERLEKSGAEFDRETSSKASAKLYTSTRRKIIEDPGKQNCGPTSRAGPTDWNGMGSCRIRESDCTTARNRPQSSGWPGGF